MKLQAPSFHTWITKSNSWRFITLTSILFNIVADLLIIFKVPFTDIDWSTYMIQVGHEGFLGGTLDYPLLKGPTGPLVYPSGYVYLYALFYLITNHGVNIKLAQFIFTIFSACTLFTASLLLKRVHAPPLILLFATLSLRVHSIWVLRLFNDAPMVFFALVAVLLCSQHKHVWASLFFSIAISIKMSGLLYLPAFFLIVAFEFGSVWKVIPFVINFVSIQALLAVPFLFKNWQGYLQKAFEFSRVFTFKWTVNWKFLPQELFVNATFGTILLGLHLFLLLVFLFKKWAGFSVFSLLKIGPQRRIKSETIILMLLQSNLIGIICARSLHYQFYIWYFYSLPIILFAKSGNKLKKSSVFGSVVKIFMLFVLDSLWVVYPSTPTSSLLIQMIHGIILCYMLFSSNLSFVHVDNVE
ncbi:hypothetical protein RCL1_002776 [Eukaryota sp. TZLM3-RCL]